MDHRFKAVLSTKYTVTGYLNPRAVNRVDELSQTTEAAAVEMKDQLRMFRTRGRSIRGRINFLAKPAVGQDVGEVALVGGQS